MINKATRQQVLAKYNGHCAYCGKEIDNKSMQVDHIISKRSGGTDDINNLNPSCRNCNHYKRTYSLEQYRELVKKLGVKAKNEYLTKRAIDYGFLIIGKEWDDKFYFEKEL